jgi:hypothetical protein
VVAGGVEPADLGHGLAAVGGLDLPAAVHQFVPAGACWKPRVATGRLASRGTHCCCAYLAERGGPLGVERPDRVGWQGARK